MEFTRLHGQRVDDLAARVRHALAAPADAALDAAAVGDLVDGRYRLERVLGRGGMGAVFVARRDDGALFALKVLHERPDALAAARFAREAQLAAQVRHPNVVRIYDLGLTREGRMYLVFELVEAP